MSREQSPLTAKFNPGRCDGQEALTFVLLSLNFCAATGFGLLVVGMRYPASWFHRGVLMLLGLGVVSDSTRGGNEVSIRFDHLGVYDVFGVLRLPTIQAWPFLEFPEISVWLTLVVLGLYGQSGLNAFLHLPLLLSDLTCRDPFSSRMHSFQTWPLCWRPADPCATSRRMTFRKAASTNPNSLV